MKVRLADMDPAEDREERRRWLPRICKDLGTVRVVEVRTVDKDISSRLNFFRITDSDYDENFDVDILDSFQIIERDGRLVFIRIQILTSLSREDLASDLLSGLSSSLLGIKGVSVDRHTQLILSCRLPSSAARALPLLYIEACEMKLGRRADECRQEFGRSIGTAAQEQLAAASKLTLHGGCIQVVTLLMPRWYF